MRLWCIDLAIVCSDLHLHNAGLYAAELCNESIFGHSSLFWPVGYRLRGNTASLPFTVWLHNLNDIELQHKNLDLTILRWSLEVCGTPPSNRNPSSFKFLCRLRLKLRPFANFVKFLWNFYLINVITCLALNFETRLLTISIHFKKFLRKGEFMWLQNWTFINS